MDKKTQGFTLVEILIALFIFTIVSMMLMSALHNVILANTGTEVHAERLRKLQLALLILSRDVEQTVNQPLKPVKGERKAVFVGDARGFDFVHAGSLLWQRTRYEWSGEALKRLTWASPPVYTTPPHVRVLFQPIALATFQYLDKDRHFRHYWPIPGDQTQPLPRAVRVTFTIPNWGTIQQLYVITAEPSKKIA